MAPHHSACCNKSSHLLHTSIPAPACAYNERFKIPRRSSKRGGERTSRTEPFGGVLFVDTCPLIIYHHIVFCLFVIFMIVVCCVYRAERGIHSHRSSGTIIYFIYIHPWLCVWNRHSIYIIFALSFAACGGRKQQLPMPPPSLPFIIYTYSAKKKQ